MLYIPVLLLLLLNKLSFIHSLILCNNYICLTRIPTLQINKLIWRTYSNLCITKEEIADKWTFQMTVAQFSGGQSTCALSVP